MCIFSVFVSMLFSALRACYWHRGPKRKTDGNQSLVNEVHTQLMVFSNSENHSICDWYCLWFAAIVDVIVIEQAICCFAVKTLVVAVVELQIAAFVAIAVVCKRAKRKKNDKFFYFRNEINNFVHFFWEGFFLRFLFISTLYQLKIKQKKQV